MTISPFGRSSVYNTFDWFRLFLPADLHAGLLILNSPPLFILSKSAITPQTFLCCWKNYKTYDTEKSREENSIYLFCGQDFWFWQEKNIFVFFYVPYYEKKMIIDQQTLIAAHTLLMLRYGEDYNKNIQDTKGKFLTSFLIF